ncbi:C39 family peptidase [Thalassobacillus hwangdonensis]|uniref:C39 family peptidase n=1 Tax=Thalassobacillus hwangdonensis TaxID=546108 RepID=A0ABW3L277_9BACI
MKKFIVALIVLLIIFIPKELKAASVKVKGVPVFDQYPELPTGCEATSLAMLLNWGGVSVSKFDVADSLPKGPKVNEVDGNWTGGNPNVAFVGDPYSEKDGSFGVFEGPILQTINTYLPGKGINMTGQSFDSLLSIVENGKPVMVWTTIDQKQTYLSASWEDEAGSTVNWYRYEHAVVLTGIEGEHVIVHDPYTGSVEHYNRSLFERNWASMGKRAVTLGLPAGEVVTEQPEAEPVETNEISEASAPEEESVSFTSVISSEATDNKEELQEDSDDPPGPEAVIVVENTEEEETKEKRPETLEQSVHIWWKDFLAVAIEPVKFVFDSLTDWKVVFNDQ